MKTVSDTFLHPTLGRTIELNILGEQKVCGFDCTYCTLGPSLIRISRLKQDVNFTPMAEILTAFGRALSDGAQNGELIDTVLVSGNGEPTLYPLFPALTKALVERRTELTSITKLVCLTNGDQLNDRDIAEALNLFDECIVKIDVGTERAFKKINRPISRSSLEKVILGARGLDNLSIRTIVTGGDFSLNHSTQLDEWIEVVAMLDPHKVYLQLANAPAADPAMKFATEDELNRISHWLERRLNIKAQVESGFAA